MKNLFAVVFVVLVVGAVPVFAVESLPDRTGFSVGAETKHDAYAAARAHRYGAVIGYQHTDIGISVTGATGYSLINASTRTESQYFRISAAYRMTRVAGVDIGVTGEFSTMPPFGITLVAQNLVGVLVPRGMVEAKVGLIAQARPMNDLAVYAGPVLLWVDGPIHDTGVGGFVGARYRVIDHISVSGDVVGADRPHLSAAVTYHF